MDLLSWGLGHNWSIALNYISSDELGLLTAPITIHPIFVVIMSLMHLKDLLFLKYMNLNKYELKSGKFSLF